MPQPNLFELFLGELSRLAEAQKKPVMCMVAGPNGAGKTTLWMECLKEDLTVMFGENYINADEMQKEFPGDLRADPGVDRFAQIQATALRQQHLEAAYPQSFIYETVFSDEKGYKLAELETGRARGYITAMIFVGLDDVELGKRRVRKRVAKGGHNVETETQEARFERVLRNAARAIDVVDLAIFLDNSRNNGLLDAGGRYKAQSLHMSGELVDKAPACQDWHDRVLRMCAGTYSGSTIGTLGWTGLAAGAIAARDQLLLRSATSPQLAPSTPLLLPGSNPYISSPHAESDDTDDPDQTTH